MKNHRFIYYVSLSLFCLYFTACNNEDRLSRDKMMDVLHDMQLVDAIYQTKYEDFKDTDSRTALLQGVFAKHGITQAQLDSSLVWYADHPEEYMRITDSVSARLKRELKEYEDNRSKNGVLRKYNHSLLPFYTYLTEANTFLDFDIDSVKVQDFSKFEISLKSLGIHSTMVAELAVRFEYADTTITKYQKFTDEMFPKISSPLQDSVKEISGYIHISAPSMTDYKVLLYDISLKNSKDMEVLKAKTDSIANAATQQ